MSENYVGRVLFEKNSTQAYSALRRMREIFYGILLSLIPEKSANSAVAVSYTHLDVYKRQIG